MIDNFLPFPDSKSLPLYRMALKLACHIVNAIGEGTVQDYLRLQMIFDNIR
jgi:hypothetical protein